MADIHKTFRSATNNNAAPPDGAPELMARSGVNDTMRESFAALKRYYDDPDFRRPFEDYTLTRVTGAQFTLADAAVESNASLHLAVGQRIRAIGSGSELGKTWEGFIDTVGYTSPTTTLTVSWEAGASFDIIGPVIKPLFSDGGNGLEVSFKELGTAAWRDIGTAVGQVPSFDDLDAHVVKAEATLDVGFVEGETRENIEVAAARRRLNANGSPGVWQRGESFNAATPYTNNDGDGCADNWVIISDGNDRVDVARGMTDSPAPEFSGEVLELTAATVTAAFEKHGLITFVEPFDGVDVASTGSPELVSLSFWAKQGPITGIGAIRAYLINLKHAEPTVPPVFGWSSGTAGVDVAFDPTDWELPTGSPVSPVLAVPLTSSWVRHTIEGVQMNASGTGVGGIAIAFVVDDASIISGAQWKLAGVQLNRGARALPYIREPAAQELARCQRYFESSFSSSPTVRPDNGQGSEHSMVAISAGPNIALDWRFKASKYKNPTLSTFNYRVASPTDDWDDGANERAVSSSAVNKEGAHIFCATATASTPHRIGVAAAANVWGNN